MPFLHRRPIRTRAPGGRCRSRPKHNPSVGCRPTNRPRHLDGAAPARVIKIEHPQKMLVPRASQPSQPSPVRSATPSRSRHALLQSLGGSPPNLRWRISSGIVTYRLAWTIPHPPPPDHKRHLTTPPRAPKRQAAEVTRSPDGPRLIALSLPCRPTPPHRTPNPAAGLTSPRLLSSTSPPGQHCPAHLPIKTSPRRVLYQSKARRGARRI